LREERIGFAFCGSFCTHEKVLESLRQLTREFRTVIPVASETAAATDTRFGTAEDLLHRMEELTGEAVRHDIVSAEPIGPGKLLDVLVIAPCTGNTIAKLANGVTDTSVTMAAKAHLRNGRPVVIAMASNDGLSANARNIGELLVRKQYFFVPFGQDDPEKKPCSLMADFGQLIPTIDQALQGKQLQPLLLRR